MICKNCGRQISDNSRFCPNCGAFVSEAERAVPQEFWSKRNIIILAASAVVLIIGIVITIVISNSPSKTDRLLLIAERHLSDHEYVKAMEEYRSIIKKEPENADAYLGLAEAYIAQGMRDAAINVLQTGIEKTGDQRLKNRQDKMTGANKPVQSGVSSGDTGSAPTSTTQSSAVSTPSSNGAAVPSKSSTSSSKKAAASKNTAVTSKSAAVSSKKTAASSKRTAAASKNTAVSKNTITSKKNNASN